VSAPVFSTNGKQVLRDGKHFADACSTEAADMILVALIIFHRPRKSTNV
jgi:hypothetical protein